MPDYSSYGSRDDIVKKDGDVGFVGFNNRLRPDQLKPGLLADAQNVRLDRNGEAQVRKGIVVTEAPFATGEDALRLPELAEIDDGVTSILPSTITAASRASDVVTITCVSHGFSVDDEVTIENLHGFTEDPNGLFTITGTNVDTFTYNNVGTEETFDTSLALPFDLDDGGTEPLLTTHTESAVAGVDMLLDEGSVTEVYASTPFSDPNDNNSQYILLASNSKVVAKNLETGAAVDLAYPTGETVPPKSSMLQAFNKVFIFRSGQTALEWDGDFNNSFTLVASGAYSQPMQLAPSSVSITDGKATAEFDTLADMNGIKVGDTIVIETAVAPFVLGEEFIIANRNDGSKTIDFYVQKANQQTVNNLIFEQNVSIGLGFTHMPAPEFAIYHQRRLIMPYSYEVGDDNNTFTDRGIRDELIVSDILDSDTYDRIYSQFRFNAGTADYIVGLKSFAEDRVLVFNRNSVHIVAGTTSLQTTSARLLTDEVGCVSRKTIIQVGNQIIFLSDNGVFSTQFLDEYNLRGSPTAISAPINETIKRINRKYWDKAVAAYFDNRYYIAVPLDGSTVNNAILVFNFLNQQWESIDTVDNAEWDISDLLVAGNGVNKGVYAINQLGGIHRLDVNEEGIDSVVTAIGSDSTIHDVQACLVTRQYTFGTMDRKKWKEWELHAQSGAYATSDFDLSVEVENPDASVQLDSLSTLNGTALAQDEDISLRGRIGNRRGYGMQFKINNTTGRPRIRAIQVQGSTSFRSNQSAI
jgi:hypothetical protein